MTQDSPSSMRIHKYMSQAGICSRRKAEEYISEWQVYVNWTKAILWQLITPWIDEVTLWKQAIKQQQNLVYYKINKPKGILTSCASCWEKNIIDIVNVPERIFPIGRLDKDSTGLLLLTNDGRLTNYLIHPRYEHQKEYLVETYSPLSNESLEAMSGWLFILGSYTKEAVVKRVSDNTFTIILTEWRNRQIRRMVEKVWARVKKLKRIRIENIELWKLSPWEYKPLSKIEKQTLFSILDIKEKTQ